MLLMTEILDPKFGMFTHIEESQTIWFNDMVCQGGVGTGANRSRNTPGRFML